MCALATRKNTIETEMSRGRVIWQCIDVREFAAQAAAGEIDVLHEQSRLDAPDLNLLLQHADEIRIGELCTSHHITTSTAHTRII